MSRQPPLVIDNGTGYTKMGYVLNGYLHVYASTANVDAF